MELNKLVKWTIFVVQQDLYLKIKHFFTPAISQFCYCIDCLNIVTSKNGIANEAAGHIFLIQGVSKNWTLFEVIISSLTFVRDR